MSEAERIARVLGKARREGNEWRCLCPAHNDHDPSLSVTERDGKLLFVCRAGCDQAAVFAALKSRGLLPEAKKGPRSTIIATYDYRDEAGALRYQVVRFQPKNFKQRRPDGKGGWLWSTKGVEPLPYRLPELLGSGESVVFIAEGEKDCIHLAAIDQVASCNHGGAGKWRPEINHHFAGRDVVILPDNDEAGRAHADKVGRNLKGVAKRVRVLALPGLAEKGDVSDWIAAGGAATELHRLAEAAPDWEPPHEDPDAPLLNPRQPLAIARAFVARRLRPLRCHGGDFYEWTGTHYEQFNDIDAAAVLYAFLESAKRGGGDPFHPEQRVVSSVLHALRAAVHVPSRITPPAWLDGQETGPLIACTNGLLRLSDRKLLEHSPAFFNTAAVGFAYDPEAPEPAEWLKFLKSLWGEDRQSIETLQEMFGYVLAGDNSHQKMFLLVGPKRGGKGTIGRILGKLTGADGTVGPTLASLSKQFGLEPLVGKVLAVVPDARLRGGSHEIIERLLAISGGDKMTFDRKYKGAWSGHLAVRFLFLTNEVPVLADSSGAIASRFIIMALTESFYGKEDRGLEARLTKELASIFNWSIDGWERLEKRGHFVQPEKAEGSRGLLAELASPVSAFLNERCELGPHCTIRKADLFAAYRRWCEDNGREHPGSSASFGRDLRAARPEIDDRQYRTNGAEKSHDREYVGLRLRADAAGDGAESRGLIGAAEDDARKAAESGPPPDFDRAHPLHGEPEEEVNC